MKITGINAHYVRIPFDMGAPSQAFAGLRFPTMDHLLIEVQTDAGITGWGESFGHTIIPVTAKALECYVAPWFIGKDPTDINALHREAAQSFHLFGRNGPVVYAHSGIDIALWDIAGKRAGLPVSDLLGGSRRTEVRAYCSLMRYGTPDTVKRICAERAAAGFTHIKLHEHSVEAVLAAREGAGPNIAIMNDVNCPWTVAQALEMEAAYQPANLYWLEEPVFPPEDHDGLARVRSEGSTRIAAGENAAGLHDFVDKFNKGAIDIAQPSVTKIGGITEMRKIIAAAEAHSVELVPHCAYFGPGNLASIHIVASLSTDTMLENIHANLEASPYGDAMVAADGKVRVPTGPGLGVEPDMSLVERYREGPVVKIK
ncbi:MAG: mandelate racemase/muconate lactonizing enzyme family protein [Chromatiales bacterium]|jgi:D-galactarolactone cycloisomerase|nr:mandelate racemase/muconate lactonizing enzyme family protein [Chromatiales bacterium]